MLYTRVSITMGVFCVREEREIVYRFRVFVVGHALQGGSVYRTLSPGKSCDM